MTSQQLAILNAMVTFAAENIPGGISGDEREVAQIVGRWAIMDDENRILVEEQRSAETQMKVHPDLLRPSCQIHGLFDGTICPLCAALDRIRNN